MALGASSKLRLRISSACKPPLIPSNMNSRNWPYNNELIRFSTLRASIVMVAVWRGCALIKHVGIARALDHNRAVRTEDARRNQSCRDWAILCWRDVFSPILVIYLFLVLSISPGRGSRG